MNKIGLFIASITILASVSGCKLLSEITGSNPDSSQSAGVSNPIIQALAPNPTAVAQKSDVMTFTVQAYAPDGSALDYTWSATKGYLSSTKGQVISWTPQKSDGSLESGLAIIQVLISNGKGGSAQGSVNILINQDGSASKQ